ncbi:MAG TPA: LysM peptidoglycan-binding domain-containing protein [Candidatus Methylomirabilis sp.]|nr:LysM peptidoglycan-binding domain-containing protein [Candidatus Methylomirabilis sp.]
MMRKENIRGALSFLAVTWLLMGQVAAQEATSGREQRRPETLPEGVYNVREGDTLWAIAGRYLDNPRLWPQIWKENPFVTNPNRIFPGDPLTIPGFGPPSRSLAEAPPVPPVGEEQVAPPIAPPVEGVPPTGVAAVPRPEDLIKTPATPSALAIPRAALECSGFVAQKQEIVRVGRIMRPVEEDNMRHWYWDDVFVDLGRRQVRRGDRFRVVRPTTTIVHPATGARVGVKVKTLGTVEIVSTAGAAPRARITYNCEDIADGDLLMEAKELMPPQRGVTQPAHLRVGGTIVGSKEEADSLGQGDIVYVDVGQQQGIVPGDEFSIYRVSGVGIDPDSDRAIPLAPTKQGELVVIRTSAQAATGLVTGSNIQLRVGEPLVLFRKMP